MVQCSFQTKEICEMTFDEKVYDMVSRIPEGKVATYGQIAKLIGYPNHARQAGQALSRLEQENHIPWHRVINARGEISSRGLNGSDDYQRILLENENINFDTNDHISLSKFQWQTE